MFDSGISAAHLISAVKSEVDAAAEIPEERYIWTLTALEQLLYGEVIREYGIVTAAAEAPGETTAVSMGALWVPAGESPVRFEDIKAVYINAPSPAEGVYYSHLHGRELTRTTPGNGRIFSNVYFKLGPDLYCKASGGTNITEVTVVYFVRPAAKTVENIGSVNVMLPAEFADIASAKLRGEAYKLMNEDALAAKWLSDYNAGVETLKAWAAAREPKFGV